MNVCTIIAKNYVSQARVLAESFREKHPDGRCTVLVIDDFDGYLDPADEPFELIGIDEIGLPDVARMAASYDVTELSTAVKPWLLRHLLDRGGTKAVTYLDPDILITESLEEVDALAREYGVVLTPHFTEPLPRDGLRPSEEDILIAGAYNLGFIALGAGETADELLGWWSERLESHCLVEPDKGLFVDQRWIDLVPGIWPRAHILRDTAYNVAYWNMPTRKLEWDGSRYLVDSKPLRFFHFSGFDPRSPTSLSKHQTRIEVPRSPPLARICSDYAAQLLDRGFGEAKTWEYGWDRLPNGVRLDAPARTLFREAAATGVLNSSVFRRRGANRFLRYLNEVSAGNGSVSRYAHAVHDARADLRTAFPDIDGADAPAFRRWMLENAVELGFAEALLPGLDQAATEAAGPVSNGRPGLEAGVNLAGYLGSELGVGEAARQVLSALETAGVTAVPIDVPVDAAELPRAISGLSESDAPCDFSLVCVNADMLPAVAAAASPELLERRRSAGLWFWEIEEFPERWQDSFDHVDEVWAASDFVADSIRAVAPIPVRTIRVPVLPIAPADVSRAELGMPEGFCFLYIFDFRSVFRRKNPLAAIEAFRRAFRPGEGASLVIKTIGGESAPRDAATLTKAAASHPDVHLIDGVVGAAEKNAMLAACDCYVSLHRSEGLGLTIAEAMYFGKPAIATNYSGNLDFMSEDNSYPVRFNLAPIGPDSGPYPPRARWAEPDVVDAARLMRAAFDDPTAAAARGRRAATDIRATHSPAAAGKLIAAHLAAARRDRAMPTVQTVATVPARREAVAIDPTTGRAQLHHLLRFESAPPRPGSGNLRRWLKRAYLRALRPYSTYQRRVDVSARDSIDELGGELTALERRLERSAKEAREKASEDLAALEASARLGREEEARETLDRAVGELEAEIAKQARAFASARTAIDGLRDGLDVVSEEAEGLRDEMRVRDKELDARDRDARARNEDLRSRLASSQEEILLALSLAGAAGDRMTELQREVSEREAARREEMAAEREEVAALSGVIGKVRTDNERIAAETQGAIHQLRDQVSAMKADADSTPYMSEERFKARNDPRLGRVIGFRAGSGRGGYRAFEELFRGPEQLIRERQRVYVDLISDVGPVVDLGCGRGEMLEMLLDAGVDAHGVDQDSGMVARCREKGLMVTEDDLISFLKKVPKRSLGCVFSAQVVEHLGSHRLENLLRLSASRLRPGGLFVAETVNPHSARALKAFWVDPTHKRPLFPETMLALCELAGFSTGDVFCPMGDGIWETDRLVQGEYAIVAKTRPTP